MKINVGDYVRTKKGIITKIEKCKNGTSDKLTTKETGIILDLENWFKDNCVKSSPNIIDLIEVGDYVNGVMVTEIKDGKPFKEDYNDPYYSYYFDDIYSIVTKEQFSQMEYRINE